MALGALLVWAALVWRERKRGRISRKTTPIGKARNGAVATFSGTIAEIASEAPLRALASDRPCAWFATELAVGKSTMSWDPEVLFEDGDGRDFWLEDETGRALVRFSRAVLHTTPAEQFPRAGDDQWARVQEMCSERGVADLTPGRRYCLTEQVVAEGDLITVVGQARREIDDGGTSRLVIRTPRGGDAIVSNSSELLGAGTRVQRSGTVDGSAEVEGDATPDAAATSFIDHLIKLTPRLWATPLLLAANLVVFAVMVAMGVDPISPDAETLVDWGGNYGPMTKHGEWWRLFTSTYLHAGLLHVAMNAVVLVYAGRVVERLVGWFGFLVMYTVSGLVGSVVSLAVNPGATSVGASGAVLGAFGCLFGVLLVQRGSIPVKALRRIFIAAAAFIGLTVVVGLSIEGIDLAAHVGGLVGGFACGCVLALPLDEHALFRRTSRGFLAITAGTLTILIAAIPFSSTGSALELEYQIVDFGGFSASLPVGHAERSGSAEAGQYVIQVVSKPRGRIVVRWAANELKTKKDIERLARAMPNVIRHEVLDTSDPRVNGLVAAGEDGKDKAALGLVLCVDAGIIVSIVSAVRGDEQELLAFQNELTRGVRCKKARGVREQAIIPMPRFQPPAGFGYFGVAGQHSFLSLDGSAFVMAPMWTGPLASMARGSSGDVAHRVMGAMLGGIEQFSSTPVQHSRADGTKQPIWSGKLDGEEGVSFVRLTMVSCEQGDYLAFYVTPNPDSLSRAESALASISCPDATSDGPDAFPSLESVFGPACAAGNDDACSKLETLRGGGFLEP